MPIESEWEVNLNTHKITQNLVVWIVLFAFRQHIKGDSKTYLSYIVV